MRILVWLVRAVLFFTLFAFALNNQHDATIRWFFGQEWRTSMVFAVLGAFALGCALGVFAMVPSWWRQRRVAQRRSSFEAVGAATGGATMPGIDTIEPHPPRDGL